MAHAVWLNQSLPCTFYWCIVQCFALGEQRCQLTLFPLSPSLAGFICIPGSAADKWAAPVTVMLSAEHTQRDLYGHLPYEGLSAGAGRVDVSLVRLI